MDSQVEAGVVRLEQPHTVTAINGNYALSPNEEMLSHFSLPASKTLTKALDVGGFKLRVRVTNRWIAHTVNSRTSSLIRRPWNAASG
jgi:hypothetical protein